MRRRRRTGPRRRRRTGLRSRLLVALLATSALTLATAAAALLPPLQDRLREQRADELQAATVTDSGGLTAAIRNSLRRTRGLPERVRFFELQRAVQARALALRRRTGGARVLVTDAIPRDIYGLPEAVYDTDNDSSLPLEQVLRTLRLRLDQKTIDGSGVTISVYLPVSVTDPYALVTQKPLTDVDAAVEQVQRAFLAAAGFGLAVALAVGLALSTGLSRRLARLRAAAVRIAEEGPDAPAPADDGNDEVGDLARTLAAMREELRRQEEARRAFVSTASHELRTPLTSLQGTLELLEEDLRDRRLDMEDAHEQVAAAQGELRRLSRLATELLDLSRLDAAVPLRCEPVELGELARAVAAEFALPARDRGVEIDVVPPAGPCWARGDPGAVARVVRILIDNAVRHSPPGAPVLVIPAYHGDHATIEVADQGPGVPPEDRKRIFERFQRGTSASQAGGFGLGLAIGRELAGRMDGTLRLGEDRRTGGARFVLGLPIEMPAGSHPVDRPAEAVGRP